MNLTMSLIKADLIAAAQAIDHYEEYKLKDIKNVAVIIYNKLQKSSSKYKYMLKHRT